MIRIFRAPYRSTQPITVYSLVWAPACFLGASPFRPSAKRSIFRKLINVVAPGTVDWNKIKTKNIWKFTQLENLNTVLDAAKRIGCNIVNLSAEDIIAGKVRRSYTRTSLARYSLGGSHILCAVSFGRS